MNYNKAAREDACRVFAPFKEKFDPEVLRITLLPGTASELVDSLRAFYEGDIIDGLEDAYMECVVQGMTYEAERDEWKSKFEDLEGSIEKERHDNQQQANIYEAEIRELRYENSRIMADQAYRR
jgi:hypothetical protein